MPFRPRQTLPIEDRCFTHLERARRSPSGGGICPQRKLDGKLVNRAGHMPYGASAPKENRESAL